MMIVPAAVAVVVVVVGADSFNNIWVCTVHRSSPFGH